MSKKYYRFLGGLLNTQMKWLNNMSKKGYRLIRTEKILYEFEPCRPNQVKYCIDFIGHKSKEEADNYYMFLEDMGYKVFYKNINLNYSIGKIRWRPWAEKGNDGKPFELHTSYEDKAYYYKNLRNPWLLILFLFAISAIMKTSVVFGSLTLITLIPVLI